MRYQPITLHVYQIVSYSHMIFRSKTTSTQKNNAKETAEGLTEIWLTERCFCSSGGIPFLSKTPSQILAAIQFVPVKSSFKEISAVSPTVRNDPPNSTIKLDELCYIQFYFTDEYVYYSQGSLLLSKTNRSVFKITHASYQTDKTEDGSAVYLDMEKYKIELVDGGYAKRSLSNRQGTVQLAQTKEVVSLRRSVYSRTKHGNHQEMLLDTPCRLKHLAQAKYLSYREQAFTLTEVQMVLQSVFLLQQINQMRVRIRLLSSDIMFTHETDRRQGGKEVTLQRETEEPVSQCFRVIPYHVDEHFSHILIGSESHSKAYLQWKLVNHEPQLRMSEIPENASKLAHVYGVQMITKKMIIPFLPAIQLQAINRMDIKPNEEGLPFTSSIHAQRQAGNPTLHINNLLTILNGNLIQLRSQMTKNPIKNAVNQLIAIHLFLTFEEVAAEDVHQAVICSICAIFLDIQPTKTLSALLRTPQCSLFVRICSAEQLYFTIFELEPEDSLLQPIEEQIVRLSKIITHRPSLKIPFDLLLLLCFRIMKRGRVRNEYLDKMCKDVLKSKQTILSEHHLVKLHLGWNTALDLGAVKAEGVSLVLKKKYIDTVLHSWRHSVHLPFVFQDGSTFKHCATPLSEANQGIMLGYLNIISEPCRSESLENKLLALQFCDYFISYDQDVRGVLLVDNMTLMEYLPVLIRNLAKNIEMFCYDEGEQPFCTSLLACLNKALRKYITVLARDSLTQRCDLTVEGHLKTIMKKLGGIGVGESVALIDKGLVWKMLACQEEENRCSMGENVIEVVELLLGAEVELERELRSNIAVGAEVSGLKYFMESLLKGEAEEATSRHAVKIWDELTPQERDILLLLMRSNELLRRFLSLEGDKANSYTLITNLLHYQQDRYMLDFQSGGAFTYLSPTSLQLPNESHMQMDLCPLKVLKSIEHRATYSEQEIRLHIAIIQSMGILTSIQYYEYYQQYILRMEVRAYSLSFQQLVLVYAQAISSELRTQFCLNYEAAIFRQIASMRTLLAEAAGVRVEPKQDHLPNRLRLLAELDREDRQVVERGDAKEFIIGWLQVLLLLAEHSADAFELMLGIRYQLIFQVLKKYHHALDLKTLAINLIVKSVEKVLIQSKKSLLGLGDWAKECTFFLSKEIDFIKNCLQDTFKIQDQASYVQALVTLIKLRSDLITAFHTVGKSKYKVESQANSGEVEEQKADNVIIDKSLESSLMAARSDSMNVMAMKGINKLFALELLSKINQLLTASAASSNLLTLLHWLENHFKVTITAVADSIQVVEKKQQLIYRIDKDLLYEDILGREGKLDPKWQVYENVNSIMSLKVEGYVVLILQILSNLISHHCYHKFIRMLELLSVYLFSLEEQSRGTRSLSKQDTLKAFSLLMQRGAKGQHKKQCILHSIYNELSRQNLQNQDNFQAAIMDNVERYFQLFAQMMKNFREISPLLHDSKYIFIDVFDRMEQREAIAYVNSKWGAHDIHWVSLQFRTTLAFLTTLSRSLNFPFKTLFSHPINHRPPALVELIRLLCFSVHNLGIITADKLAFIHGQIELVNNLMHGPVQANIKVAVDHHYEQIFLPLLQLSEQHPNKEIKTQIIRTKQLVMEAISLLIPHVLLEGNIVTIVEKLLQHSYSACKKICEGDMKIILESKGKDRDQLAAAYFQLSLQTFYCMVRVHQSNKKSIIFELLKKILGERQLKKTYSKKFKIFYQVYKIFAEIIETMLKKAKKTYEELISEENKEKILEEALQFFISNSSSVEVNVGGKISRVYFLLLKESQCMSSSIRKELHRQVGTGPRAVKLVKLMEVSKEIILRLEIQKEVYKVTEKFRPLDIIVRNRQLWKSMNFLMAVLLNLLFLFSFYLQATSRQLLQVGLLFVSTLTYIFSIFLFIIYFLEGLKLRIGIANYKRLGIGAYLFYLLRDKTLWFATIYTLVVSLSFYNLAFVSLLMLDFFARFKVSRRVTIIFTKPILKILYVLILTFSLIDVFAQVVFQFGQTTQNCGSTAACTQDYFLLYFGLRKNDPAALTLIKPLDILATIPRFLLRLINVSLIIGLLLSEKKRRDLERESLEYKRKMLCFICEAERSDVDRSKNSNKGFFDHIETEHNLWNYIFYLIFLKDKCHQSLNTVETAIVNQWNNNEIDWLPDRIS